MKKILFSLVAVGLLATTIISCQSDKKAAEKSTADTAKIAASTATVNADPAIAKTAKTGSEVLDVSPEVKVETPQFSNEEVNNGFAEFEPLKQEYLAAVNSKDAAKMKELTAKYNKWVKDASSWGNKLSKDENQIYIDHYTKLVTQWDKITPKAKK